jgi:ParB family chromosome partitioning protein
MAKTQRLGRGLDILLGQVSNQNSSANNTDESLQMLALEDLQRGEFQPREDIDPTTLNELAESIVAQGIIQPLIARKLNNNQYEIIAGERRWHAAKIAGLKKVPVIVRKINDQVALAIGLIENIQREALTPLEEAKALQQLIEDFKMTHEEISNVVGRSRSSVSNLIRLLQLADSVKSLLGAGKLEMGHARALLPLEDNTQLQIAEQVVSKSLSVRQTENLVKNALSPRLKKSFETDPEITQLTDALSQKLNCKADIKTNGHKGKIVIHYQSQKELAEILNRIH